MTRKEWLATNKPNLDIEKAIETFCPDEIEDMPARWSSMKQCGLIGEFDPNDFRSICEQCWNKEVNAT